MTNQIRVGLRGLGPRFTGWIEPPYPEIPPPPPISGGGAALMVASPTSLPIVQERADYDTDGVNDAVMLQTALNDIAAAGGGELVIAPGTYTLATGLSYDSQAGHLDLIAYGATFTYEGGAGHIFDLKRAAPVGALIGPRVYGGTWNGNASATDCFFVSDIGRTEFHNVRVAGLTGVGAYAWSLWNQLNWTENTLLQDCEVGNCTGAVNFTPASLSGGTGTNSFARTKIRNLRIGGTGIGPMINCRGSVYGSEFSNTHGNVSDSPIIYHMEGGMSGTKVYGGDLEGSAFTYFRWGTFTGSTFPTLYGPFPLGGGSIFETGTRPNLAGYNLPIAGQSLFVGSSNGITLTASNGSRWRITVNTTGDGFVFTAA